MSRKQRIKLLETEFRLVNKQLYIIGRSAGYHSRHNKYIKRYWEIVGELEKISIKWKIKKIIRRIKKLWQK